MKLMHPYPATEGVRGVSFGGNQRASADPVMRRCGCGVVAATDLLLYLHRWHAEGYMPPFRSVPMDLPLKLEQYDRLLARMRQKYFPIVYPFGTNGIALAVGLNRFFRRCGVPYRARWGVPASKFWETMEQMLAEDLPVILSVGMNFPKVWEKETLNFYRICGENVPASNKVRAHFVVVTGMDEEWLQISTWGAVRYIRRSEYESFMKQQSGSILSNLLLLRKI